MSKQKRIFVAINLPPTIKKRLAEIAKQIKESFPEKVGERAFKWVKPRNLHITLAFLGNTKQKRTPDLKQVLKKCIGDWEPFSVQLKNVCYGPSSKLPPNLIWVEGKRDQKLAELVLKMKKALNQNGLLNKIKRKEFLPHITLARVRKWQWRKIEPEDRPDIERELDLSFKKDSIDIMESKLRRKGPEYKIVESFFIA